MAKKQVKLSKKIEESFNHSLKCISEHHYTIQKLKKDLKHFEAELDRQHETNSKIVDGDVRKLIQLARQLLTVCMRNGSAEFVPHCLAAVDYLVNCSDAITDFEEYDGFDDDQAVFEAVVDTFGLKGELKRSAA